MKKIKDFIVMYKVEIIAGALILCIGGSFFSGCLFGCHEGTVCKKKHIEAQ